MSETHAETSPHTVDRPEMGRDVAFVAEKPIPPSDPPVRAGRQVSSGPGYSPW